jgi:hypothetical protein
MTTGSSGVRPHSIWNQISITLPLAGPTAISATTLGKFMEWPALFPQITMLTFGKRKEGDNGNCDPWS